MKIGLTYDLRDDYLARGLNLEDTAEFDPPETIEAIEKAIRNAGHETIRIGNVRHLISRLNDGERWDLVFNICEGLYGPGREAMVPALLDEYQIPYTFSDPMVLALTLHKGHTKSVIREAGIQTADYRVAASDNDLKNTGLKFPLFVKPVSEGAGKGIDSQSKVTSDAELGAKCRSIWIQFEQPAIIEEFLPGKDFTVSILGTGHNAEVINVTHLKLNADAKEDYFSFHNKENLCVTYEKAEPDDYRLCEELALRSWKVLGCRDAGRVDVRFDAQGVPNFIEVNPLPEINPVYSELTNACLQKGITHEQMIQRILNSALNRIHP